MPFGPGLQPGEPPLLNRPTVARRPDRSCGLVVDPSPMDVRWSRRRDSNPEPAVYKTAALPIELRRRDGQGHTADDPIRRRGMIGPTPSMGQASGSPGWAVFGRRAARLRGGVGGASGGGSGAVPSAGRSASSPGSAAGGASVAAVFLARAGRVRFEGLGFEVA